MCFSCQGKGLPELGSLSLTPSKRATSRQPNDLPDWLKQFVDTMQKKMTLGQVLHTQSVLVFAPKPSKYLYFYVGLFEPYFGHFFSLNTHVLARITLQHSHTCCRVQELAKFKRHQSLKLAESRAKNWPRSTKIDRWMCENYFLLVLF